MSKKVTESMLKDLIVEMLTESRSIVFQVVKGKRNYFLEVTGLTSEEDKDVSKVKALARLAGVPDELLTDNYTSSFEMEYEDPASFLLGSQRPSVPVGMIYGTDGTDDADEEDETDNTGDSSGTEETDDTDETTDAGENPTLDGGIPVADIMNKDAEYSNPNANDVLDALQNSFGEEISQAIMQKIAALTESRLSERVNPDFEISDIVALMNKATDNPKDKFSGTNKTNLDIAAQVDDALKKFIGQVKDPGLARRLAKSKIQYDRAIQASRGLSPEIDTEFSTSSRIGMPASIGGDVKTPVDPLVLKSFDTFFDGKSTFKARLEHLEEFSKAIVLASNNVTSKLNAFPPEVIITGGNVMSMLSKLTRQMDPSAGGYFAEAFLAFLVGGSKTGQAQGAGDFKGKDGKNYSSKWGSSSKNQASSNFTQLDSRITYITADKATENKVGTSQTMKVLNLTLKIYDIITTGVGTVGSGSSEGFSIEVGGIDFEAGNGETRTPTGASGKTKTGDYDVSPPKSGSSEFNVILVTSSDQVFDQIFSKAVNNISDKVVRAAARFNSLAKQLEENTNSYSVSSDFTEAVQMADAYKDIKTQLATIYTGKTGEADASSIGLAEQKVTASLLKKLIEENFKK